MQSEFVGVPLIDDRASDESVRSLSVDPTGVHLNTSTEWKGPPSTGKKQVRLVLTIYREKCAPCTAVHNGTEKVVSLKHVAVLTVI